MTDVVVVGGGPAGSLAALVLARAGFAVRVFDRARFPRPKLCGDTMNPGACRVLSAHVPLERLLSRALPIHGMLLTGPGGVAVRGTYDGRSSGGAEAPPLHDRDPYNAGCSGGALAPPSSSGHISGYAIERRVLDHWLLEQAAGAGAEIEDACAVDDVLIEGGEVRGVRVHRGGHACVSHHARLVIAADGRHSRLAFALGLARHPRKPRRWAIGAYFEGVDRLSDAGEMHVRRGHYIGVAPMPDGLANACLVLPHEHETSSWLANRRSRTGEPSDGWRDVAAMLTSALARDPELGPRFARARMAGAPAVLGPMAVDVAAPGTRGLLLAGDAAGFIDPMTGDGLTFALRGSVMAADMAIDVLSGRTGSDTAVSRLASQRRRAFANKWRFNRSIRRLVASPRALSSAAIAARVFPSAFEAIIRYAGDLHAGAASAASRHPSLPL